MKVDIREEGIIAILRNIPCNKITSVVQALYDGGIRIAECTFEQEKEGPEEILVEKVRILKKHFGDCMMIGAGTVLTENQVEAAHRAGCELIITPNTDTAVIKRAKKYSMTTVIGAVTPTEIVQAKEAGADFVKIFPAGALGTGYFSAIKAPLSHIPMLAVGGIGKNDLKSFMKAGAEGFGIGSPLIPRSAVIGGDYNQIKKLAEDYVQCYKAIKNEMTK